MPDLVVTKTNDTANGQVEAGDTFTWTLTIENRGNVDAIVPRVPPEVSQCHFCATSFPLVPTTHL
ncbi:MAG: hypothetical protein U5Q44_11705 [Dehalococcoidia bacterium]|nr:hypothetical protein [Dehalococcoidia bacterium]